MKIKTVNPELITAKGVRAFFTLKNKAHNSGKGLNLGFNTQEAPGVIKANRDALFKEFHIDPNHIAFANQVHSNRVKIVKKGGTYAETDALVTQIPGLALAIQVADCAAVLIADLQTRIVAAVHAGWRGASGDIIPRAIEQMQKIGCRPQDCKAFISPCISVKNFEVGKEVAEQFPDRFVDDETFEKPHVNLKLFLQHQLIESGLQQTNIELHTDCTVENHENYYSYRREKDQSGRMMAIIQLKKEPV